MRFPSPLPLRHVLATATALAALAACQAPVPTGGTAPERATTVAPAQKAGPVSLVLLPPRDLLTALAGDPVNGLTRADIAHVVIDLVEVVQVDGVDSEAPIANRDVAEDALDAKVVFDNLKAEAHYRIKARAYAGPGTQAKHLISLDDERSWTEVYTTNDEDVVFQTLRVQLRDVAPMVARAIASGLSDPVDVVFSSTGELFFSENGGNQIKKVPVVGGLLGGLPLLVAGDGALSFLDNLLNPLLAQFNSPQRLTIDAFDNLFVVGGGSGYIRMVAPGGGVTSLPGTALSSPKGIAVLPDRTVLVTVPSTRRIMAYVWNGSGYNAPVVWANTAGARGSADGDRLSATFDAPADLTVDASGNVFVADPAANAIRKIAPDGRVTTVIKTETGNQDGGEADALINGPRDVAVDAAGNVYFSEGFAVRKFDRRGVVSTLKPRNYDNPLLQRNLFSLEGLTLGPDRSVYVTSTSDDTVYQLK
jgi:hypothetical protein